MLDQSSFRITFKTQSHLSINDLKSPKLESEVGLKKWNTFDQEKKATFLNPSTFPAILHFVFHLLSTGILDTFCKC